MEAIASRLEAIATRLEEILVFAGVGAPLVYHFPSSLAGGFSHGLLSAASDLHAAIGAQDAQEYVAKAVRLATEPEVRRKAGRRGDVDARRVGRVEE